MNTPQLRLSDLFLITGFASVSAVLVAPALPALTSYFSFSATGTHAIIALFLFGYTIGQWLYGPITQRVGRKPTLLIGIGISLIGTTGCLLASVTQSAPLFLISRFIQALGSSAGLIVSLSMVHDVFMGPKARQATSLVTLAFAVLPGVAVLIGGFIIEHFDWQMEFIFLALYSIVMILITLRLPETSKTRDPNAFTIDNLFLRYARLFSNRTLIRYACMWGSCTAVIYIFSSILPVVAIESLSVSPAIYSYAFLSTSCGLVIGNLLSAQLAHQFSGRQLICSGFLLCLFSGLLTVSFYSLEILSLKTLFIGIFPTYIGMPLIFANASVLATDTETDKTTAASFVSLLNLSIAVSASFLVDFIPLDFVALIPVVLLLLCLSILRLLQQTRSEIHYA